MNQRPVTHRTSACFAGFISNAMLLQSDDDGTGRTDANSDKLAQGRQIAVIGCGVWGRVPNRIQAVNVGR